MPYFISILIFIVIQTFLIITVKVNIYPEFFFLPWLVGKGFIPYRDFFDHHGFLLYYLLAPLTFQKSLFFLKTLYLFMQTINLISISFILKKTNSWLSFLLGSSIYLLLSFFIAENTMWYELFITTIYLLLYNLILLEEFKFKAILIALLISLASFIKPTAALILLPVLLLYKNLFVLFYFLFVWSTIIGYFYFYNGLRQFFDNLFLFNLHYADYFSRQPVFYLETKFVYSMLFVILLSYIVIFNAQRAKESVALFLFTACSLVFMFPTYTKMNLTPFIVFFIISISAAIKYSFRIKKLFLLFAIIPFFLFLIYKTSRHYKFLKTQRSTYLENSKTQTIIDYLKNIHLDGKRVYTMSNEVELYYFLNQTPSVYFPLVFPWITRYFSDIQERIIADMKKNQVQLVIVPIPLDENYLPLSKVMDFVKKKFQLIRQTGEFQVYSI